MYSRQFPHSFRALSAHPGFTVKHCNVLGVYLGSRSSSDPGTRLKEVESYLPERELRVFCELLLSRRHECLQVSQDRIKGISRSNRGNECSCFDCLGVRFGDESQVEHHPESTAGNLVLARRFDGLAHGQAMGTAPRMVSSIGRILHLGTLGQGRHGLAAEYGRLSTLLTTAAISSLGCFAFWLSLILSDAKRSERGPFITYLMLDGLFASAFVCLSLTSRIELVSPAHFAGVNGAFDGKGVATHWRRPLLVCSRGIQELDKRQTAVDVQR